VAVLSRYADKRALRRFWLAWRFRAFQRHRHRRLVIEHVAGTTLLVLPEVFNPSLFFSSEILTSFLDREGVRPGMAVLDMGTGSGICAVVAARCGARVVAVDILPEAVRCARINALLNGLDGSIDVRQGDLFAPVKDERFDLILFNPPFYSGAPGASWEHAWRSEDVAERFALNLGTVLAPGGRAVVVLSSEAQRMHEIPHRVGLSSRVLHRRDVLGERFTIVEWKPTTEVEKP